MEVFHAAQNAQKQLTQMEIETADQQMIRGHFAVRRRTGLGCIF
jgi:hypothetical protein